MAPLDNQSAMALCRQLGIQPLTARILVSRGITTADQADAFLNPTFEHLGDPSTMLGVDRAVHRVLEAIRDRDPILVFGDSDVDGITAASCVYQFIARLGVQVSCLIPTRTEEGYGLTVSNVKKASSQGHRLIITTDCGVSNVESITHALQVGIDVIVVDHHTLPPELPPAVAILNPLQPDCAFPFKRLAAVGVAFNFISALNGALKALGAFPKGAPDMREYLDIVALGTVADAVPLLGDNRVFVRMGLEVLRKRRRAGIQALMERAQIDGRPVTARTIGYRLAPLINAAGRMGDANRCVDLMTTDSYSLAIGLARELEHDNTRRQQAEREILKQANELAETAIAADRSLLLLSSPTWHEGVLGIVASRIKEAYHRPAAIAAINPASRIARASLRATPGVDLIAALSAASDKLISFGGHTAAAGMTLAADDLDEVYDILDDQIRRQLASLPGPSLPIDTTGDLAELDHLFNRELLDLAPFGVGHPEPILIASDVRCVRKRVISERHLRVQLRDKNTFCDAIGFTMAPLADIMAGPVDVALTPRHTLHRGKPRLELQLRDARPHLTHEGDDGSAT